MQKCPTFFMNRQFKVKILRNADLKNFCTFRIGGSADFVFIVENTFSLVEICKFCKANNIKFKVIGLGANLLFADNGYRGAIIVNRCNNVKIFGKNVYADSGVRVGQLIQKCISKHLCGLENLAGIPSTVGGAVVNSLGAYTTNFYDYVDYVICYDTYKNKFVKLKAVDCEFGYRTSAFKHNNLLILRVKLKLKHDKPLNISTRMQQAITNKKNSQPLNKASAGSVFKRSEIIPAKVIDELNLKGTRVGDAEISTKHAGFIVNLNSATSNDVKTLITFIKNKVKEKTEVDLETEIEFVD